MGKSQEMENDDIQIARSKGSGIRLAKKVPEGETGHLQVD